MAYTNTVTLQKLTLVSQVRDSEKTLCPGLIIRLERSPKSATSHLNYKFKLFASSFLFLTTNTKRKKNKQTLNNK